MNLKWKNEWRKALNWKRTNKTSRLAPRSGIMYSIPISLVKDTRTKLERSDIDVVLDGEIDDFIKEFLLDKERKTAGRLCPNLRESPRNCVLLRL